MLTRFISVLGFVLSVHGCSTLTSMQTARTTKKGKSTAYFALGSQGIRFTKKGGDANESDVQTAIEKIRVPILEGGFRHGFSESWDAGARYALIPGTIGLDTKYALNGLSTPFGTAVGLGLDYTSFGSKGSSSSAKITIIDTSVPFYMSYDFAETSAFYFTPRFIYRTVSSKYSGESDSKLTSAPMFGGAIGVMLGWFAAEYSMVSSFGGQSSAIIDQITFGVRINVGEINHHSQYAKLTRKASQPSEDISDEPNDSSTEVIDEGRKTEKATRNGKNKSKKIR